MEPKADATEVLKCLPRANSRIIRGIPNRKTAVKRCDGTPNRSRAAGHDCAVAL